MNRRRFLGFLAGAVTVGPSVVAEAVSSLSPTWICGEVGPAFTPALIDRAIAKARATSPKIWPVSLDGRDYYVAIVHPRHPLLAEIRDGFGRDVLILEGEPVPE